MLDEYRELYREAANSIPGWETMDRNDLCRLYIANEHDSECQNKYFSALMCRYWNLIPKFYNISHNLADPIDCYNWLIDAILYTLKHRRWEDEDASIANDPQGPDKMINRCMKSCRLIHYQFYNRKKRRKEYNIVSLEDLKESLNSDSPDIEDPSANIDISEIDMSFCIREIFMKKEYFLAFILDLICMDDVFESEDDKVKFNLKRVSKLFRNIDERHLRIFADRYNLPYEQVYQAAILAKNVPAPKLTSKIQETLLRLKHSDLIKSIMD